MTYAAALIDHHDTPLAVAPFGFWTRSHPWMKASAYSVAILTGLALVPALFVSMDHESVVRWSNQILDLVSL